MAKKIGKKYEENIRRKESENNFCCKKALEILIRNTKSVEHLDLVERTIVDYEAEFSYDLTKYKKILRGMRKGYQS